MDVTFQSGEPLTQAVDALVVPVTRTGDGPEVGGLAAEAAAKLGGELKTLIADARFTAKIGSTLRVPTLGNLPARHLILTGIGYPARLDADRVRRAWAAAAL
ncbi:MAG TPA: M17 family peptidase N-terminal domain-containing protein, partial [Thermomicrobiales bacterium]|nr:M17 family peptidase N-terminal domain-containing protein [Thermomicrobiales bacterium]